MGGDRHMRYCMMHTSTTTHHCHRMTVPTTAIAVTAVDDRLRQLAPNRSLSLPVHSVTGSKGRRAQLRRKHIACPLLSVFIVSFSFFFFFLKKKKKKKKKK